MSVKIDEVLDAMVEADGEAGFILLYGYNYRTKLTQFIMDRWNQMPWYKRFWWTLKGKRPV